MAVSGLPEIETARVRRWCEQRVPEHTRDQVRVDCEVGPRGLTILERRPPWNAGAGADWSSLPVARLMYAKSSKLWSLHWRDRNLRFHRYDQLEPAATVAPLLAELDRDPTGIFWG
jgi:hypothetical protein